MKKSKIERIAIALAVAGIAALSMGCGSSNPSSTPPVAGVPGAQAAAGGCLPISGQIPFTGANIYVDFANIVGGTVPMSNRSVGTLTVGGAPTGGPFQRSGSDGTISMNLVPVAQPGAPQPGAQYPGAPYPGYPTGTFPAPNPYNTYSPAGQFQTPQTASASGFIAISPLVQADIMRQFGNGMTGGAAYPGQYPGGQYPAGMYPTGPYSYPGQYPGTPMAPTTGTPGAQPCVSGIAINVGHYNNLIYGGNVFLYMNNTQHGYVMYF